MVLNPPCSFMLSLKLEADFSERGSRVRSLVFGRLVRVGLQGVLGGFEYLRGALTG